MCHPVTASDASAVRLGNEWRNLTQAACLRRLVFMAFFGSRWLLPFTTRPGVARRQVTFFCFAKREVTKEKATRRLGPFAFATGNLRCSTPAAVQTTRLRLKQVWPDLPPPSALLGPASTGWGVNSSADSGSLKREALEASVFFCIPLTPCWPRRGAQVESA
jgi:hypothetical protein